jgi:hypothetical protein
MTPEERAAAALAAQQAAQAANQRMQQQRRDLAMVDSYATEADLRRSLVSLLDQANALELSRKPIPPALLKSVRSQHADLEKQLRITAGQRAERVALDGELAAAVDRYRAMKGEAPVSAAPAAAPTSPSPAAPPKQP